MENMPEHTPAPTPIRAVYGFAMYLSFKVFFVLYLIWAFTPNWFFDYIGVTCLPQRYWAVAIPIYVVTAVLIFGFVIYPSINLCITPDVNDFRTIADTCKYNSNNKKQLFVNNTTSNECVCTNKEKCDYQNYLKNAVNYKEKFIPLIEDLDITQVSRLLYLKIKSN